MNWISSKLKTSALLKPWSGDERQSEECKNIFSVLIYNKGFVSRNKELFQLNSKTVQLKSGQNFQTDTSLKHTNGQ